MSESYVLLDRDGVINFDSDDFIKSAEEWEPIPGSLEAIALLNQHDFKVIVITNQSGIGRGLYDETVLTEMHNKMHRLAGLKGAKIETVYFCPHIPEDHCQCRKPKPGMLKSFANDQQITLNDIYFIGDKLADIQAAEAAGANPILVKTGKGQKTLASNPEISHPIFENLYDAAKFITA